MTGAGEAPLRVLFVLDSLVPGGAETSTVGLFPHLQARGVEPTMVILHDRPGLQEAVRDLGIELISVAGGGGRIGWTARLASTIRRVRPDLVHTSLFEADVCGRAAALIARVPALSTIPTELYGPAHLAGSGVGRVKVRLAQALDIATARSARRLHAVSHHVAGTTATGLHYPAERIDVVHRGRPDNDWHDRRDEAARSVRDELGLGAGPLLLTVARLEEVKGLDRAVAALPAILDQRPDATLALAGRPGADHDALVALAERLGVAGSVRLLGHRDDVDRLLAGADVFLLPSRREGMPGALLEAMAAGTPAVINDLPQITEVAGPGEAWVIDAGDRRRLADTVIDVLDQPGERAARAASARERFLDRFTIDASADGMADLYRRVLGCGGTGSGGS